MPDILKCRIEDTHSLHLTVPSPGVSEGDMGLLEDTVYAWLEDYETGELGVKIIEAERIVLPKENGVVFAQGDYVYYDDTNKNLTTTHSGDYRCGTARADAAADDATVEVDFWGHDAVLIP
jgi:predicted RecA/RadA family phage recombinase